MLTYNNRKGTLPLKKKTDTLAEITNTESSSDSIPTEALCSGQASNEFIKSIMNWLSSLL